MVTFKSYISINEIASSIPETGTTLVGGRIKEIHRGVRNLPLSSAMKTALTKGLQGTGVDWNSYSGGQPSSGGNRVGSHRHDYGNGTDGDFIDSATGRVLNADNPQDRQKIALILKKLKTSGVQGFGWDSSSSGRGNYMGPTRFHLDVAGPPGVWGSSKRGDSAAPWIVSAIGGVTQGNVEGDLNDGINTIPGSENYSSDYDSPIAAMQGLAQGVDLAFGSGMFQ